MSMVGCFASIDQPTQQHLMANPSEIEAYLYPDEADGEPNHYTIDVDKAWHGIHYILTGTADGGEAPLALAIFGGVEIGDDVGYGPARLLDPMQVKAIANALGQIDEPTFRARFAPEKMQKAEIYPREIWIRDGEEALDYLVDNYSVLVKFYEDTAALGCGVILWLA
jgi:hypothetical protein